MNRALRYVNGVRGVVRVISTREGHGMKFEIKSEFKFCLFLDIYLQRRGIQVREYHMR